MIKTRHIQKFFRNSRIYSFIRNHVKSCSLKRNALNSELKVLVKNLTVTKTEEKESQKLKSFTD